MVRTLRNNIDNDYDYSGLYLDPPSTLYSTLSTPYSGPFIPLFEGTRRVLLYLTEYQGLGFMGSACRAQVSRLSRGFGISRVEYHRKSQQKLRVSPKTTSSRFRVRGFIGLASIPYSRRLLIIFSGLYHTLHFLI